MSKPVKEVKNCCSCDLWSVCAVREAAEKLISIWARVSMDGNKLTDTYTHVASNCRVHTPIKKQKS